MSILEKVSALAEVLRKRHWKLATAESCTGGGLAYWLTAIPGSSEWFDCGFVTYSNTAKQQLLGVDALTLEEFGAVSEQTARAMAEGALRKSTAQISIAITGIAGPEGGSAEKPVGTVWFAWTLPTGTHTQKLLFSGTRTTIREQAIQVALVELHAYIHNF